MTGIDWIADEFNREEGIDLAGSAGFADWVDVFERTA